jgi:hypothetical protein
MSAALSTSLRAERSNPLLLPFLLQHGLLRSARNDDETQLHDLAAGFARVLPSTFRPFEKRAWGMPGARRTRSLVCAWGSEYAHEYSQRGRQNHPASPRNGFNGVYVISPAIGLCCHRRLAERSAKLDAGVEASGPHDLAVRFSAARRRHLHVHRIPPRVRDDREPPL